MPAAWGLQDLTLYLMHVLPGSVEAYALSAFKGLRVLHFGDEHNRLMLDSSAVMAAVQLPSLEVLTFNLRGMSQAALVGVCCFAQGRDSGAHVLELGVRLPAGDGGEEAAFECAQRDFEALFLLADGKSS